MEEEEEEEGPGLYLHLNSTRSQIQSEPQGSASEDIMPCFFPQQPLLHVSSQAEAAGQC